MTLVGGLGFFLYGMKMMSEGLQKAAGPKMRSILEMFTRNRVVGVLVGTFFTALIQSSNAATVMIVSFVNSGLMQLGQTAGILMGANIGGTVTGQLIAFDLASIAPLFVMAGVLMVVFANRHPSAGRLGEVILGFGILPFRKRRPTNRLLSRRKRASICARQTSKRASPFSPAYRAVSSMRI